MAKKVFKLTNNEREALGESIRKFRGVISQKTLADRIGIPRQYRDISRFENAKAEPSQMIMLSMAQVFGVNVYDIIPQKAFSKLAIEALPKNNVKAFDVTAEEEKVPEDMGKFDIMITDGLLYKIFKNNPYSIEISYIITAGLNHFLNMDPNTGLKFVLANVKNPEWEKALMDRLMDLEKYRDGIEVLRSIVDRERFN